MTLESPTITEIAVTLGLDWVVIDTEHGSLDFKEVVEHIRVTRNSATTPLVRIPETTPGIIKRVLDLGAHGIIVPQVNHAEDVAMAVKYAKYPPLGTRGVGGDRATLWGLGLASQTAIANQETMVIPLIETVTAGRELDAILDVPGIDASTLARPITRRVRAFWAIGKAPAWPSRCSGSRTRPAPGDWPAASWRRASTIPGSAATRASR